MKKHQVHCGCPRVGPRLPQGVRCGVPFVSSEVFLRTSIGRRSSPLSRSFGPRATRRSSTPRATTASTAAATRPRPSPADQNPGQKTHDRERSCPVPRPRNPSPASASPGQRRRPKSVKSPATQTSAAASDKTSTAWATPSSGRCCCRSKVPPRQGPGIVAARFSRANHVAHEMVHHE
jgi:hypothetical protein